jgi:hypothetical protein
MGYLRTPCAGTPRVFPFSAFSSDNPNREKSGCRPRHPRTHRIHVAPRRTGPLVTVLANLGYPPIPVLLFCAKDLLKWAAHPRIIGEVACNDLLQPVSLIWDSPVHALPQLRVDLLKLCPHAAAPGLPLKLEGSPVEICCR